MKDIVVTSLLGKERINIEGFVNYHSPWVKEFIFVYNESDPQSLEFCQSHSKCRLIKTEYRCHDQEHKARNELQNQVDYALETAMMLDLDERLDLRTLLQTEKRIFEADITIGIINNCDNYFLIDGYPRQIFANKKLNYVYHTHSWAKAEGKDIYYLDFPKVNHFIQKPYKKSGFETEQDVSGNAEKFLDKLLIKLFIDEKYVEVANKYLSYCAGVTGDRQKFMTYMIYVLACEKANLIPKISALPFFEKQPTKTEAAIDHIFHSLLGDSPVTNLSHYSDNVFGVKSTYAQKVAMKLGATDTVFNNMWRS